MSHVERNCEEKSNGIEQKTRDEILIQKSKDVHICAKQENKALVINNYIHGKYKNMKCSFDEFVSYFEKVHLVKLNKENWAKSTCNCTWFLKNYNCYHLIAVAVNENLVEVPLECKNVSIGQKNKRGRKKKAKRALEKQDD